MSALIFFGGITLIIVLLSVANPPKQSEHDKLMNKERAMSAAAHRRWERGQK